MTIDMKDIINGMPADRREKVEKRAAELIAEEMTLRQLRKAHRKTQAQLSKKLNLTQDQVSRIEQRSDFLLSTLRKYVEGMGGSLKLVAEFPKSAPVILTGVTDVDPDRPRKRPQRAARRREAALAR